MRAHVDREVDRAAQRLERVEPAVGLPVVGPLLLAHVHGPIARDLAVPLVGRERLAHLRSGRLRVERLPPEGLPIGPSWLLLLPRAGILPHDCDGSILPHKPSLHERDARARLLVLLLLLLLLSLLNLQQRMLRLQWRSQRRRPRRRR